MKAAGPLGNALESPLRPAQRATGAKSFDDPILGSERPNRRGLRTARVRLAHAMAGLRRGRRARPASTQVGDPAGALTADAPPRIV